MNRCVALIIFLCIASLHALASFPIGTNTVSFTPSPDSSYPIDVQTNAVICLENIVGLWTNKTACFYDDNHTTGELDIHDAGAAPLPQGISLPTEFTQSAQGILEITVPEELFSAYVTASSIADRYTNAVSRLPAFVASVNNREYTNTPPAQIQSWVYTPNATSAAYEQMADKWILLLNSLNLHPYTTFSFYTEPANTYGFETETLWVRLSSRLSNHSIWGNETELVYAVWFDNAWHIAWIPV